MKIAFGTVVYDLAYKFHKDFVRSINSQDTEKFDVLLLNDDLSDNKWNELIKSINRNVVYKKSEPNASISELRIELIRVAKENEYDLLVLGDFDDVISENRVRKMIAHFDNEYSFFYNDLYYLNSKSKFFNTLPLTIEDITPILECNFLGLSNTAVNINRIDFGLLDMLKTRQTVAFDWTFFSLLLLQGHKGKMVENCQTYYRIHEENTAGNIDNSIQGLKKEIEVKVDHYSKLLNIDTRYSELYKFYYELKCSFSKYTDILLENSVKDNQFWWGNITKTILKGERLNEN